jgi:uncharacterized protein HemY
MEAPVKELKAVEMALETGRQAIAKGEWSKAEEAVRQAIALDEHQAPSYELMAALFEAQGREPEATEWREKAKLVRRQVWQRQVEAEARGHHEMLGEPSRHEIP